MMKNPTAMNQVIPEPRPAPDAEGDPARHLGVGSGARAQRADPQEDQRTDRRANRDRPERRPPAEPERDGQRPEQHVPVAELWPEEDRKQGVRFGPPFHVGDHVDAPGLDPPETVPALTRRDRGPGFKVFICPSLGHGVIATPARRLSWAGAGGDAAAGNRAARLHFGDGDVTPVQTIWRSSR